MAISSRFTLRQDPLSVLDARPMDGRLTPNPVYRDDGRTLPSIMGTQAYYSAGRNTEPKTNTPITANMVSFRSREQGMPPAVSSLAQNDLVFSRVSGKGRFTRHSMSSSSSVRSEPGQPNTPSTCGEFLSLPAVNYLLRNDTDLRKEQDPLAILDQFRFIGVALSVDQQDNAIKPVSQVPRVDFAMNVCGSMSVCNIWDTGKYTECPVGLSLVRLKLPESVDPPSQTSTRDSSQTSTRNSSRRPSATWTSPSAFPTHAQTTRLPGAMEEEEDTLTDPHSAYAGSATYADMSGIPGDPFADLFSASAGSAGSAAAAAKLPTPAPAPTASAAPPPSSSAASAAPGAGSSSTTSSASQSSTNVAHQPASTTTTNSSTASRATTDPMTAAGASLSSTPTLKPAPTPTASTATPPSTSSAASAAPGAGSPSTINNASTASVSLPASANVAPQPASATTTTTTSSSVSRAATNPMAASEAVGASLLPKPKEREAKAVTTTPSSTPANANTYKPSQTELAALAHTERIRKAKKRGRGLGGPTPFKGAHDKKSTGDEDSNEDDEQEETYSGDEADEQAPPKKPFGVLRGKLDDPEAEEALHKQESKSVNTLLPHLRSKEVHFSGGLGSSSDDDEDDDGGPGFWQFTPVLLFPSHYDTKMGASDSLTAEQLAAMPKRDAGLTVRIGTITNIQKSSDGMDLNRQMALVHPRDVDWINKAKNMPRVMLHLNV